MLPVTVEKFKRIYSEKNEVIEWMLKHGSEFEKVEAKIIKEVALGL